MSFIAGIPVRPLEPLKVSRHPVTGELWLEWKAAADRPENWPVVGFVVEAVDRQAAGEWTAVGSVERDLMSNAPTRMKLDDRFHDGTYAFRVFADNRAALSAPLESEWITPDVMGISLILSQFLTLSAQLPPSCPPLILWTVRNIFYLPLQANKKNTLHYSNFRTIVENTPFLCLSARLAH